MIDKIPAEFLMEIPLSVEQEKILIEQMNRFNSLNQNKNKIGEIQYSEDGRIMFTEGTIIHGITLFSEDKIDSISRTGILTGQAIGKSEDGETYYCADFHRVKKDISVEEYSLNFSYKDGRCPFGKNKADNSKSIAFVIIPTRESEELLAYDCYRDDTYQSDVTKSFINYVPLKDREVASSILYGVPSSEFQGIVVGGNVLEDNSKIHYLVNKFPNCYIITSFGELLYDPRRKESTYVLDVRIENALLNKKNRRLLYDMAILKKTNNIIKNNYDNLMNQMLSNCSNEDIMKVLVGIGWQSGLDEDYVENLRKRSGR